MCVTMNTHFGDFMHKKRKIKFQLKANSTNLILHVISVFEVTSIYLIAVILCIKFFFSHKKIILPPANCRKSKRISIVSIGFQRR